MVFNLKIQSAIRFLISAITFMKLNYYIMILEYIGFPPNNNCFVMNNPKLWYWWEVVGAMMPTKSPACLKLTQRISIHLFTLNSKWYRQVGCSDTHL